MGGRIFSLYCLNIFHLWHSVFTLNSPPAMTHFKDALDLCDNLLIDIPYHDKSAYAIHAANSVPKSTQLTKNFPFFVLFCFVLFIARYLVSLPS